MFNKIRNWMLARSAPTKSYYHHLPNQNYVPTDSDIDSLANALDALIRSGIRLSARHDGKSLRDVALEMANREGFFASNTQKVSDWTSAKWAIIALWQLSDEDASDDEIAQRDFDNAALIQDHCYDGAEEEDYTSVLWNIVDLAKKEWRVDDIQIDGRDDEAEQASKVVVHLQAETSNHSFEFDQGKDLDWRFLGKLNALLPKAASNRFAFLHDGGSALVVFLASEQIDALGKLMGLPFDPAVLS